MYQIFYTNRMKKDIKRAKKRGKDISKLIEILDLLKTGKTVTILMLTAKHYR